MSGAQVVNQALFKTLTRLGSPPDEAIEAASGFVVPAELDKLATKEDLKSLESRLTQRMVLFVGGSMVLLTQFLPAGKLGEVLGTLVGHLTH